MKGEGVKLTTPPSPPEKTIVKRSSLVWIKILGIHFLYHNETKTEQNFLSTVKRYKMLSCIKYKNTYFIRKDSNL